MKTLHKIAPGKINLTLDILGKRPDGFHEVSMIMQSMALGDEIFFKLTDTPGIKILGDVPGVLKPEDNLMYKAADLLAKTYNLALGVELTIKKNLPVAAGLAGGSSDAGAVLLGLNELLSLNIPMEELLKLGAQLGSDIPFTMVGGTMLATGRGEILKPCISNLKAGLVLVKPEVGISTPWAYSQYAKYKDVVRRPDEQSMLKALADGDLTAVVNNAANVFEDIMLQEIPEIKEIKDTFTEFNYKSLMSGSGPTVFALTIDFQEAENLAAKIRAKLPHYTVLATELK